MKNLLRIDLLVLRGRLVFDADRAAADAENADGGELRAVPEGPEQHRVGVREVCGLAVEDDLSARQRRADGLPVPCPSPVKAREP